MCEVTPNADLLKTHGEIYQKNISEGINDKKFFPATYFNNEAPNWPLKTSKKLVFRHRESNPGLLGESQLS